MTSAKTKKAATKTKTKANAQKPAAKKSAAKAGPAAEPPGQKLSALEAAARVLTEGGTAMTCKELVGLMAARGYWSSPRGKTPDATLQAAIIREIASRGRDSRFKKTAPGRFAAAVSPVPAAPAPAKAGPKAARRKAAAKEAASPAEQAAPAGTPVPEGETFRL